MAAHKPGLDDLTKAERRILKLIAEKKTSKEIATELFISPRTVDNYRNTLFEKLKVRTRVGLVMFAIKNGLVEI